VLSVVLVEYWQQPIFQVDYLVKESFAFLIVVEFRARMTDGDR